MRNKKQLKRIVCIGIGTLMMMSMAGCSQKEEKDTSTEVVGSNTDETEASTEETNASEYYSKGLADNGFLADFNVADAVTVGDYKSIVLSSEEISYTDADVEEQIQSILDSYASMVSDAGIEIEDGDTVNIDYVGSVDGEEFDGGNTKGQGTEVTIGVTSYIDGFLEQLIGHKTGEEFDIDVTFPDPYKNNPDLAGKDAVFHITINSVLQAPELTDEFVTENYSYADVDEFRESVRDNYDQSKKKNAAWEKLMETVEVSSYPEEYVDALVDLAWMQQEYYIYMNTGYDLATYLSAVGTDEDTFREQLRTTAEERVKTYIVAQYICELEGIEPTMDTLKEFYVSNNEDDIQNWIDYYGSGYIMQSVLLDVAAGRVLEYTTIE